MMTRLVVASALALSAAGAAFAADAPKSTEACMEQAFAKATAAQEKKLSKDKSGEVEGLLTKMEDACTASKFEDAAKIGADIDATIGS